MTNPDMQTGTFIEPAPAAEPTFAGKTKAEMASFRAQYGEDRVVTRSFKGVQVILRAPEQVEFNRYVQEMGKMARSPEIALNASRRLVLACLLAPSPQEVGAAMDRYVAMPEKLAEVVLELAGADAEVMEETF